MVNRAESIADAERLLNSGVPDDETVAIRVLRSVFQRVSGQKGEAARKTQNDLNQILRNRPDALCAVIRQPPETVHLTTPTEWRPGISILSCCMDRNDLLIEAMRSWVLVKDADEIVVLDWSSTVPVAYSLARAGINDPRIRVVRVEGEARWMASHAWNLAFRTVRFDTVLKIDGDVVVGPDFLERHSLKGNDFLAGNWRTATPGQNHINGLMLIRAKDFLAAEGYDERIVTYGWEDDEFYDRLTAGGMQRFGPQPDSLRHIDHDDLRRANPDAVKSFCAWQETEADSVFWLALNRRISPSRAPWPDGNAMSEFAVVSGDGEELVLRRAHPFAPDIARIGKRKERVQAAIETIRYRNGRKAPNVSEDAVNRLLSSHNLADCLTLFGVTSGEETVWTPPVAILPPKRRLLIDARYGLGNRMRAIASAAVFAKITERELAICWERDHHCDCDFGDLFAGDHPIVADSKLQEYQGKSHHFIDLMDLDGGEDRLGPIDAPADADLHIRSAFTLLYPNRNPSLEDQYLRSLIPSGQVSRLLEGLPEAFDVTAHIRMQGSNTAGTVAADARGERTAAEHDTIDSWRERSHYTAFVERLDALISEGARSIFVASDSPEAYQVLTERYGNKISCLPREVYDRSAEQLIYALADLLLLSRAPIMLGSGWSSFTEIAHRLASGIQRLELSGRDF